jgi:hypothetical protein
MAKKPSTAMRLDAKSTPAQREAANRQHQSELIGHTLDGAVGAGHGHAVGTGSTGKMVPSDAHLQAGQYIGQAALNVTTRDGGAPFDENQKVAGDYGTVDKTGD